MRTLARNGRTSDMPSGPPKLISRTASCAAILPRAQLVNRVDQRAHMIDRCLRQDAVPEVEDVSWSAAGALQDGGGAAPDVGRRGEQCHRIEIALHAAVVADGLPGGVEVEAPVDADDV